MHCIEYNKLIKYNKQWVAFTGDYSRIVGHGKSIKKAVEKANENGIHKPILMFVSPALKTCIV